MVETADDLLRAIDDRPELSGPSANRKTQLDQVEGGRNVSSRERRGRVANKIWRTFPQAYEIPRRVPALGESVRNRPEVTRFAHVAGLSRAVDL